MRRVQCSFTTSTIILFSALIFLAFIHRTQARDRKPVNCSTSCGEVQNIKYPFRLNGDPSGCGDPDYEFSCVNGKTILEIFPGKYYVHNISYDDQNLRLVDVNFANGSCSLPSGSVKTAEGKVMDFRFQGDVIYYASRFRFVKCSKNISSLPTAANYTRVPCLAATNGSYFYAVYVPEYYYPPQPSCSIVAVAPVDYHPDMKFMKFTSYKAVMKLLQAGFDIGWSVKCRDCSLAGKGCAVSSWVKPHTYECYTDAEYKEPTELQIILIYVAIAVGALIGLLCIILILVVVIRRCRRTRNEAKRNLQNQNQQSLTPEINNS